MESSLEFSSSLGSVSSLLTRWRTFKVLVIGDSGVGKTCLTHRLCAGEFPSRAEATIGVDFRERLLDIDGEKIKVTGEVYASLQTTQRDGGEMPFYAQWWSSKCFKNRVLIKLSLKIGPLGFYVNHLQLSK